MAATRGSAWIIEDHAGWRTDVVTEVRRAGYHPVPVPTQERLVDMLASAEPAPDLVVLDLRLPWADEATLADDSTAAGVGCLNLLRAEPTTARVPIIVFSAYVKNDITIAELLRPYQPLPVIEKKFVDNEHDLSELRAAVENLHPAQTLLLHDRMSRQLRIGERELLRVGALIGAVTAVLGVITWIVLRILDVLP